MKLAAIDIGSNAVRLLINSAEQSKSGVVYKKIAYLRVPIRLGEDVFTSGYISTQKQSALIEAMTGFSSIMKAYDVDTFRACATSAMRDATNGSEIIESIKHLSNIEIDIISGEEEAYLIHKASEFVKIKKESGNYLYADVGGGSTEIVLYKNQNKILSHSFQLGTVRMISGHITEQDKTEFSEYLKMLCRDYAPFHLIASGGNINKVHKILQKKENEPVKTEELMQLYNTMKNMTFDERMQHFKLNAYRADVIIPALYIFTTIAASCEVTNVYVPRVGLSDGIIHQLYEDKKKLT